MEEKPTETSLNVFTLNCWGLLYVSSHRQQRIKSIAQHLKDQDYDIVFLQEVWCHADFEHIRSITKIKYPFAHVFKGSSVIGTSGLVVLSKWKPSVIHFEPFTVNGSPFRLWHGDFYAAKGVGYVRINIGHVQAHLFCTHMHAQYDENEKLDDQYSVHRICQSYQLAKFINLMTHSSSKKKNSCEMIVLAGDLNTSAKEIPYQLLASMTCLKDCYLKSKTRTQVDFPSDDDLTISRENSSQDLGKSQGADDNEWDEIEEHSDYFTCYHHNNSFTPNSVLRRIQETAGEYIVGNYEGKRIDFIMYKLVRDERDSAYNSKESTPKDYNSVINAIMKENDYKCFVERVECSSKDPVSGLSFSDHQPVVAKLKITTPEKLRSSATHSPDYQSGDNATLHNNRILNEIGNLDFGKSKLFATNGLRNGETTNYGTNGNANLVVDQVIASKLEDVGLISGKTRSKSILTDIADIGSKVYKNAPLQLKQLASSAASKLNSSEANTHCEKIISESSSTSSITNTKNYKLLQRSQALLEVYLRSNQSSYKSCLIGICSILLLLFIAIVAAVCYTEVSMISMFLLWSNFFIIAIVAMFLVDMFYRVEQNAVNSVLTTMMCDATIMSQNL